MRYKRVLFYRGNIKVPYSPFNKSVSQWNKVQKPIGSWTKVPKPAFTNTIIINE